MISARKSCTYQNYLNMNISKYNHYIEQGESCIIFNAYTVSFLITNKRDINKFLLMGNFEELEKEQPQLFYDLCKKGMLIPAFLMKKQLILAMLWIGNSRAKLIT